MITKEPALPWPPLHGTGGHYISNLTNIWITPAFGVHKEEPIYSKRKGFILFLAEEVYKLPGLSLLTSTCPINPFATSNLEKF